MRTTLDIDDDILAAARHLAQDRSQSPGRVLSDLARLALQPAPRRAATPGTIPILPRKPNARPVTMQAVKDLLEAEG